MLFSAYDRAAIKFRGVEADINFSLADYENDLKQVGHLREEREHILLKLYLVALVVPYHKQLNLHACSTHGKAYANISLSGSFSVFNWCDNR